MTCVYFQNRGRMNSLTLPKYLCLNFFRKFKHRSAKRNSGGLTIYIKEYIKDGISIVRNHYDTLA